MVLISHILDDHDHVLANLAIATSTSVSNLSDSFWIISVITSLISALKASDVRGSMAFESDDRRFFIIGANGQALESSESSFTDGDYC